MADLSTTYMGIPLENPLIVGASPLTASLGSIADICSSTGIFTGEDMAKMILAGATAVQTVSALLRHGPAHIRTMLKGLDEWMERRGYSTLSSFRGKLSRRHSADPWAYTRAQYVKLLMDPRGIMNTPASRKD